ncbi:uncharacterized protein [Onthophagus taurus]|uniref:uncharacterized protein n=1 Tax=Onthophagus taurus TaxID=166361 RepID=UPI000C2098AB|nr:uncharacterized protein LOC111426996 [Onthophagus taurus]
MEEFLNIKWRIQHPNELDYGLDYIPEREIANSYIYNPPQIDTASPKLVVTENVAPIETVSKSSNKFKLKTQIKSFLNAMEQTKCLNALHILQIGKKGLNLYDRGCMELYNNVHNKIIEENQKFLQFAKKNFLNQKVKAGFTKPMQNYADLILKKQLERCKSYPERYKQIDTFLHTYTEENNPIEMVHLGNLLELGSLAKFTRPTLITPYYICSQMFPNTFQKYHSKLPVSQDGNIKKLLTSCEAEVVISASGLKRLLNFTEINSGWEIPIIIEEIDYIETNGINTKRNIIFIDKPLPKIKINEANIVEKNVKIGLKANFCTPEALKYPNSEEVLSTETIEINPMRKQKANTKEENVSSNSRKLDHNVSYRLWHLRQENEESTLMKTRYKTKDVKVLVRCKLDACEAIENNVLQPISLHVKLEHQPEFGGGILTKTELISQWVSLFFRPYSQLCRFRVVCKSKQILTLENCNIQSIKNELLTYHNYKPSLGFGALYKLFLELKSLSPGNYLLQHLPNQPSVTLLQSSEDGNYNLHKNYDIENWTIIRKYEDWCPIDCSLILPKHQTSKQMPGLFPPNLNKKLKGGKRKPKLTKAQKNKNAKKKKISKKIVKTKDVNTS